MCVCESVFARGMGWGEVKSESKNKQKSAFEEREKNANERGPDCQ